MLKEIRSFIKEIKLRPSASGIQCYSNGDLLTPVQYKIVEERLYTKKESSKFKAIGFEVLSVEPEYKETEFVFKCEISINMTDEKQKPKVVKEYMDLVAGPVLSSWLIDKVEAAEYLYSEPEEK